MNTLTVKRWGIALGVAIIFFGIALGYILFRRESFSFSTVNKAFGSAAILLAGFTLLIRFLMARMRVFYHFMTIRRQLGIYAFLLGLVHMIISVFFVPTRFTFKWYTQQWLPIALGAGALIIWVYLTYISRNEKIKSLGNALWQKHQRIGARIAFFLVYLHVILLKYPGWVNWWMGTEKKSAFLAHPTYIPESLLVFFIMTGILIIKIVQMIRKEEKHGATTAK